MSTSPANPDLALHEAPGRPPSGIQSGDSAGNSADDPDCAMPPHNIKYDSSGEPTVTDDEVQSLSDISDTFSNKDFDEPHQGSDGDTAPSESSDLDSGSDIMDIYARCRSSLMVLYTSPWGLKTLICQICLGMARNEILEEERELWGAHWSSTDGSLPDYGWAGYALQHYPDEDILQLVMDAAGMRGAEEAQGSGLPR
ncbi:hypothetical protein DXG01_016463 [Tephrocybe rancida]|nr:hypothetical protein DXG01_016463 [Tephrocybe rancida]